MKGENKPKINAFRIAPKIDNILNEVCEELAFRKVDLIRILLTRAVFELKADSIKAGGIQNLTFQLKEFNEK